MVLGKLCHVNQWPNQSSYTSNHLIAKRDEYPCHAKQWPTPTSQKYTHRAVTVSSTYKFAYKLSLYSQIAGVVVLLDRGTFVPLALSGLVLPVSLFQLVYGKVGGVN